MGDTSAGPNSVVIPAQNEFRRDVDFVARYANNIQFETNPFDLKLTFGIMDLNSAAEIPPKVFIDQHTSMNISWPEVKLLLYFLQLHIAGYEKENGKIKIPVGAMPPEPPTMVPPQFDNPQAQAYFEMIRRMRAEFIAKES